MSEETKVYDKLRILLSPDVQGFAKLPKHPLTDQLLENLYTIEEATLITSLFSKTWEQVDLSLASKRSGKSEEELKAIFLDMAVKGKIQVAENNDIFISAYIPGIFEFYFVAAKDDPEKMNAVAQAHYGLMKMAFNPDLKLPIAIPHDFNPQSRWRIIPAIEPALHTIEINETVEGEAEILPFEMVAHYLSKYDIFAVSPCACRTMTELAGNPCKWTSENFCMHAGPSAEKLIRAGFARQVTYDEMMDLMKKAEAQGLVHSAQNFADPAAYICNCCPCCCAHLMAIKEFKYKGRTAITNFMPVIDTDQCTLCGSCEAICPMEVISSIDEVMKVDLDFCIGCGVCASNCPEHAIALQKIRNTEPLKESRKHGFFG